MTFDPIHYKTTTRQQWEDYAGGWNAWTPLLETWLGNATERMLDLAGVSTGDRVLDVAAGAGGQSIAAGRRVGPDGTVLATDLSPTILEHAHGGGQGSRAGQRVDPRTRRRALHDLPAQSFDAAISRVGLIYFPDRHQALTGIRHALRDGGRFAHGDLLHRRDERLLLAAGLDHPRPGASSRPGTGPARSVQPRRPRGAERDLIQAGFHDVVVEVVEAPVRLPSAAECVRFERESFGALHQMLGRLTPASRTVWAEIEPALGQFETEDGFVGPCELVVAGATR